MSDQSEKCSADFDTCCGNFPIEEPIVDNPDMGEYTHAAHCEKCEKRVESNSRSGLVRKWNGESPSTQLCSGCGSKLVELTWAFCPHCACPTSQK